MIALNNATLDKLPGSVERPGYDRATLDAGIAHIGVGNFHRAHQAVFIDRCLRRPDQKGWAIVGIGLRDSPGARRKADAIRKQDGLYTLTEYAPDGGVEIRVIGAMIDYLLAPENPEAVLALLADPKLRIVSLTITEGGYKIDEASGAFRTDDPEIAADTDPNAPRTVFGMLVSALARRREAGLRPFSVVSCDNLRENGDTARKAVVGFARLRDPDLADWIDSKGAFPNSMVDRIAPQISEADARAINETTGIDDATPVTGETFIQWVIEDKFADGRPDLAAAGVELRDDVAAFESTKGRLLNAAHVLMSYPSLVFGHRLVHEAMADERVVKFTAAFLDRDAMPLVQWPTGVSPRAYRDLILARFANPQIRDQLERVASDGVSKIAVFHTRTLRELIERGGDLRREALFLACFARYLDGTDDRGATIEVSEPNLSDADRAKLKDADGLGLLRIESFASLGLDREPAFVDAYRAATAELAAHGAAGAVERLLAATDAETSDHDVAHEPQQV